MPEWMQGDVLDVRMAVTEWLDYRKSQGVSRKSGISHHVSSLAETGHTYLRVCNIAAIFPLSST